MKRIRTALCLILAAALLAGCAFLPSDSEPETLGPHRPAHRPCRSSGRASVRWPWPLRTALPPPPSGAFPRRRWCWKPSQRLGTSTELCLVYPALAATPKVGPVAAGQDIYWRLLVGQQPHSGAAGRGTVRPELSSTTIPSAPWTRWKPGAPPSTAAASGATRRCGTPAASAVSKVLDAAEHLRRPDRIPGDERRIRGGRQRLLRGRRRADRPCASAAGSRRQAARRHRAGRRERPGLL